MLEKLFKKVPIGSDITLMNVQYQRRRKDEETERWLPDFIAITYKDNTNGKKDHVIIKNPKYTFAVVKPDIWKKWVALAKKRGTRIHSRLFVTKDKIDFIEVPYHDLEKTMAQLAGWEDEYKEVKMSYDRTLMNQFKKKLYSCPMFLNSDQSIEDHYRFEFNKFYGAEVKGKLAKSFYDIEVDNKYLLSSEFPEPELAECPVNAISFLDEIHNKVYTFLLRDLNNPKIDPLIAKYQQGIFNRDYIYNFVTKAVGGWKQMERNGLKDIDFELYWFDEEINLLKSFFATVVKLDPDFIVGWNGSAFDFNYLTHRIRNLGYDPRDIICDPNWETQFVDHYVDTRNINDYAERGDYTKISSNTVWLDQMIQFCSRRKSQMGHFTSFKLDDIAWGTAKVHKLDYSDITTDIAELPYLDYETFVLYNIMDVINQKCIEFHTGDIDYIFTKCLTNCVNYAKGHRQTVYLIDRFTKEWDAMDLVIGNNINRWNKKPEKYQGALVENPLTVSDYSKKKINKEIAIMVIDNSIDNDFKSLYPSIDIENNIAPHTQYGRIDICNHWKAQYTDPMTNETYAVYVKDPGVAYEYPMTEVDKKRVPKKIELYLDKNFTQPLYTDPETGDVVPVPYVEEQFKTLEYEKFYPEENPYGNDKYSRGGDFAEDLVTDNYITFTHRWFKLATFMEFLEDFFEYQTKYLRSFSRDGKHYNRFYYDEEQDRVFEIPFRDVSTTHVISPFKKVDGAIKPLFKYKDRKHSEVNLDEYNPARFNGVFSDDN